ncbi:hypothetical protein KSX19_05440 [Bifidobacterium longum]|uniref:hypothetical protein n=1 Tax=Bifidobacterium longum TaxID=216816 RepID=UPI001C230CE5|nr:hypothetical protein [Bifidobacterium longum]MBU9069355.1 hypothetical protein [Bifidobacterium longum]MBU9884430.1 hypothetical protein [Bifidobacterium longum]MBV3546739.1 hypothetical protein [Bifidobacterium longum]MBV3594908.1 hypothetical protein [Bifidobacterium longum]MBV3623002.1 hypothetical protein [Bifidobacterium longum]
MQMTLPGFEAYDTPTEGLQEIATKELIESYTEGKQMNPSAVYICKTMINIARNFDALNAKGRDTSRVMAQLLSWYQELETKFPATPEIDPALAGLLTEAKA